MGGFFALLGTVVVAGGGGGAPVFFLFWWSVRVGFYRDGLVFKDIRYGHEENTTEYVVRVVGRRAGVFELLLDLFGWSTKAVYEIREHEARLEFTSRGIFGGRAGASYHCVPLQQKPS